MHHGVEGKQTPHRARPSQKATRYPEGGTSLKAGPGRQLQGEGKQQPAGEGSRQQPNTGQTQRDPHRKAHDGHGKTQAETPTHQKGGHAREEVKHKTKDKRRQEEHSPNQDRTKPPNQTNKRETKPGTEPHGGMPKDAYHTAASGSKSQCGADCTVKVPLSQPCFDHFFGPCFRGHDEAGLLAFEALQGLLEARGQSKTHGDSNLYTMGVRPCVTAKNLLQVLCAS